MPKTYKKSNKNKSMRACKTASASLVIGEIGKNTDTFILTYGQFSLIDALIAILDKTGPAHVTISTWTAGHAHLDKSAELMESASILSLRMIVDRSFKTRQPKYYEKMVEIFSQESIREINTHAKFMTIRNDDFDIVVRTSMNLNENPRLENIEISENKDFADFFKMIADDIFSEIAPGEKKVSPPKLANVDDYPLFKNVSAEHIKINNIKEASYTHEIKNDEVCETTG